MYKYFLNSSISCDRMSKTVQVDADKAEASIPGYVQLKVDTSALEKSLLPRHIVTMQFDLEWARRRIYNNVSSTYEPVGSDGYVLQVALDFKKPGVFEFLRKNDDDIKILLIGKPHRHIAVAVMAKENVTASDAQKVVDGLCKTVDAMPHTAGR